MLFVGVHVYDYAHEKLWYIVIVEDDISLCSSNNVGIFILSTLCL